MADPNQDSSEEQLAILTKDCGNISAVEFFDAALRPEMWPEILRKMLEQSGQTAAALSGQGRGDLTGPFFSFGLDEDRIAIFMRDYGNSKANLALDVFDVAPTGVATPWTDIVAPDRWDNIPLAKDLVFPMGLEWKFAVKLFWDGEYGALLSVLGPPNGHPVGQAALDEVTDLVQYMAPAFKITCRMAMAERENRSLWGAISTLGLGLLVQNHSGGIIRMNARAEAILGESVQKSGLAGSEGRFTSDDMATNYVLLKSKSERPIMALRFPMQLSSIGRWNDAHSYLVVLLELDRDAPQLWPILRNVFGATSRQVEVAKLLLDGETSHDIAAHLGISANTVDTHIDRLCIQTGTANRTMLRNWMMQLRSIV